VSLATVQPAASGCGSRGGVATSLWYPSGDRAHVAGVAVGVHRGCQVLDHERESRRGERPDADRGQRLPTAVPPERPARRQPRRRRSASTPTRTSTTARPARRSRRRSSRSITRSEVAGVIVRVLRCVEEELDAARARFGHPSDAERFPLQIAGHHG
jgi:hypothetical protein